MKIYIIDKIRVNNFQDGTMEDIMDLWQGCYEIFSDFAEHIQYGIYSEYESNYKGNYTLSVGTNDIITENPVELNIDKYIIYKAKTREEIPNLWEEIWDDEENHKINRSYEIDCERYNQDGTVDIFIGIK